MAELTEIESESSFHATLKNTSPSTLLVVFFYADWAAPCGQVRTILNTLASMYAEQAPTSSSEAPPVSFLSISAEEYPDISESYEVTAVPFLVLLRDGKVVETVSGSDAAKIRDAVERNTKTGQGSGNASKAGIPPMLSVTPRTESTNGEASDKHVNGLGAEKEPAKDLSGYAPKPSDPNASTEMTSGYSSNENYNDIVTSTNQELHNRLSELVKAAPVMLFMKGTPSMPQCGFSKQLVSILREKGVKYGFFNILADDEVRQGLKEFADWPTFPQLWMGGELVGGLDIVKEELESDPDFLKPYSVSKIGGPAGAESQTQPATASA